MDDRIAFCPARCHGSAMLRRVIVAKPAILLAFERRARETAIVTESAPLPFPGKRAREAASVGAALACKRSADIAVMGI